MERRAREPTYTFITTRKREGGGEEKEGKKNMGERRKRERERENLHENTESFEERFP